MTDPIKAALDLLHSHPEFAGLFQATTPRVAIVLQPNWEALRNSVWDDGEQCESCVHFGRGMERHGEFAEPMDECTIDDEADCPGVEAEMEKQVSALKADYCDFFSIYTVDGEKAEIIKKLAED